MTTPCRFVGGSMDGAVRQVPAGVTTAATIVRDGGRSWYELDDSGPGNVFVFVGHNETGEVMAGFGKAFSEAARKEREAVAEASRAQGCASCGRTFGSPGAFAVAHDGRCLPDHVIESALVEISGVWCSRGTDVTRR